MVRVTLRQVAEEAGVSVQTVSNVLNNRTQQTWKSTRGRARKIRDIADRLGYRPNAAARAMRNQRSMQIGVLMHNDPMRPLAYLAAFEMVLGINARLEAADYVLSLVRIEDISEGDAPVSRVFHEHLLDGMIVVGGFTQKVHQRVEKLSPQCVWLETNLWRDELCVRRDDRHVGKLVGLNLAKLGYRHAIWLGAHPECNSDHFSIPQRYYALEETCHERHISLRHVEPSQSPDLILTIPGLPSLLRTDTAIVAYNTQDALALSQHAASMGLVAGRDYGLVCCDEEQLFVKAWPGLSPVSNDRFGLGTRAADMMLRALEDSSASNPSQVVRGHWIAGDTAWGPEGFDKGGEVGAA